MDRWVDRVARGKICRKRKGKETDIQTERLTKSKENIKMLTERNILAENRACSIVCLSVYAINGLPFPISIKR